MLAERPSRACQQQTFGNAACLETLLRSDLMWQASCPSYTNKYAGVSAIQAPNPRPPPGLAHTHIQMCAFECSVAGRRFWCLGRTAGPLADWQKPEQTAEHVFQLADTRLSFIQHFELQNNGSVLPSILLTCLSRLSGIVLPSILLNCLSRLSGRIELNNPKTHKKVATAAALDLHRARWPPGHLRSTGVRLRSFLGSGRGSLTMRVISTVRVCSGTLRHVVRTCFVGLSSRPRRSASQYLQVHQ